MVAGPDGVSVQHGQQMMLATYPPVSSLTPQWVADVRKVTTRPLSGVPWLAQAEPTHCQPLGSRAVRESRNIHRRGQQSPHKMI
jgi:hypothetical protein